jgi:hypothetical protein
VLRWTFQEQRNFICRRNGLWETDQSHKHWWTVSTEL